MELHIANATINITAPHDIPGALAEFAFGTARPGVTASDLRHVAQYAEGEQLVAQATASHALGSPPTLGQVWPGQGGIYVATVPAMLGLPDRHLIASIEETKLRFGPTANEVAGAKSHVDGIANTLALLADGEKHPAARWCVDYRADGHSDFHLPSRFDLLMAYLQYKEAFSEEGWYWSSTQDSRDYAFVQDFGYGLSHWGGKGHENRVRAFRWIHLDA